MSPGHRFWKRFYNAVAPLYDPILALGQRLAIGGENRVRRQIIGTLHLPANARVIELGAGTLSNALHLPPDSIYIATDISIAMLRRGQAKLSKSSRRATLVLSDAQHPPFASNSADLVLCMGVIQHLSNPLGAIKQMRRLARSGAPLLLIDEKSSLRKLLPLPLWQSPAEHHLDQLVSRLPLSSAEPIQHGFCADYFFLHFKERNPA